MKSLIYLFLLTVSISLRAQRDSLRYYYQDGINAYENKDYGLFLSRFQKANDIRPNHPTIVYNLASAYAINNKTEECVNVLRRLVKMNSSILENVKKDSSCSEILKMREFNDLETLAEKSSHEISNSSIAYSVPIDSIHVEGISFDTSRKIFYFGSVHNRSLYAYDNSSLTKILSFSDNPNLFSVLGVAYSAKPNRV